MEGDGDVISNYSSSWRSSDHDNPAQIDLVIERGDRIINLCEMKFSSSPYTIDKDYEMRLRERMGLFVSQTRTRCGIHITLVTTFGVVRNSHYHSIVNSEVCLDDLFAWHSVSLIPICAVIWARSEFALGIIGHCWSNNKKAESQRSHNGLTAESLPTCLRPANRKNRTFGCSKNELQHFSFNLHLLKSR